MRGADSIMTKEPAAGALKGFLAAGSSELLYGFGRLSLSAPMQALSENGMARQGEGGKEVWFVWLEMSGWSTNTRAIQQSIAMPQRNRSSHVQGRAPVCDYTPRCSRHPWRHDFPLQKTTCPNAPTSVFMSRSWSLWIFFNCVRSKCSLREHSKVQSSNRPDRERHHAKPSDSPG